MTYVRKISFTKKIQYVFETLAVYIFYYFFAILPYKIASDIGAKLGLFLGKFIFSAKVADINLQIAFPEKTADERREIINKMWENLGRIAAEYPHLEKITNNAEFVGLDIIDEIKKSNNAAILFSAHLGNWELAPYSTYIKGVPASTVYRKPNNLWVDGLIQRARGKASSQNIAKGREGARQILSLLKANKNLGILVDQKLDEGIAVPFFNKDAMTADAIAVFALKLNCPLYPIRIVRENKTKFKVILYPKLEIENSGDKEKDVYNILCQVNKNIEEWIKEKPEQWLWIHRRWDRSNYK